MKQVSLSLPFTRLYCLKTEDVLQLLQNNEKSCMLIQRKLLVSIILLNQIMTEKVDTYFNCIPEMMILLLSVFWLENERWGYAS